MVLTYESTALFSHECILLPSYVDKFIRKLLFYPIIALRNTIVKFPLTMEIPISHVSVF